MALHPRICARGCWPGSAEARKSSLLQRWWTLSPSRVKTWAMGHGTKVGEGSVDVITTKNVLLRLQAPRFFVEKYGPQPEGRVIRILSHVCGSLFEAHSLGLVHRDIKPANIMLNRRGGEADVSARLRSDDHWQSS